MCTMEDVPTAAPAVHNVKDTMEDAPINTDMSRSPFCPPSSPIDVVPIVAVEFFMAAPNSQFVCAEDQHAFGVTSGAERFSFGFLNTTKEVTMEGKKINGIKEQLEEGKASVEALYGRKRRTPLHSSTSLERNICLGQETRSSNHPREPKSNSLEADNLKGNYVHLNVSPIRGLHKFKVKKSYPSNTLDYSRSLQEELKKCIKVLEEQIPFDELSVQGDLSYAEHTTQIRYIKLQKSYKKQGDQNVQS
ncbi:hypothetical protein U9M48_008413 [Paspalum notatum var. saurae]|uniref:Uncharacterized protein n=1 Tax=Paspalum notatum var. saurae TaxID=547442 RepID=A0AAQ3WD65_PASNO